MPRRGLIAGGLVVVAATAGLIVFLHFSTRDSAEYGWRPVKWTVMEISPDQRRLHLMFASGGCTQDRGRAEPRESSDHVQIRVEAYEAVKLGADMACTADLRRGRADLRLRRPLAGRRLAGASTSIAGFRGFPLAVRERHGRLVLVVPRVAGLRADAAATLLTTGGFLTSTFDPLVRERVVGTRPRAGTELRIPEDFRTHRPRVTLLFRDG